MTRFVKLIFVAALFLLLQQAILAQCPTVALNAANGNCLGTTLSLSGADSALKIVWYKNGTPVKTVGENGYASSGITVAGGNGTGTGANQLNHPIGIYVDAGGNIFVTDIVDSNSRIQKWAPGASSGTTVAGGHGYGFAADKLNSISDVYVDAAGNIFIADTYNHRIQKWVPGADSGITVAGGRGYGSAANQLYSPSGVYVDVLGNIFVADQSNHRIQKWGPGADSGITLAGGHGYGAAANQFYSPAAVYVDASGNIFVADWSNNRVQKWTPGATSGITVAGGHGSGAAANQLNGASDLYVDATGNIFIADTYNHRIQKWAPGADSGITVAGGRGYGSAANQFYYPRGVWLDVTGNLFITDNYNNRVQKWGVPSADTIFTPTSAGNYTVQVTFPGGCLANSNAVAVIDTTHPTIGNFFPKKVRTDTVVTITGTHFYNVTAVSFGGVAVASFTIVSSDTITAVIGAGASGSVIVSTLCAGTASLGGFQYCSLPAPVINATNTCLGDTLRLSGAESAQQITWYNNNQALPVNTPSIIPGTAGSYMAIVKLPGGCTDTSTAVMFYTTLAPVINSFYPQNAGMGISINITGTNFSGTTAVSFGGLPATSFTVVNDNLINAIIGAGNNGNVGVTTPCGGTGSLSGFKFCTIPAPVFTSSATCLGDSLRVSGADSAVQIVWYNNGAIINSVSKTGYVRSGITVAGGSFGNAANQLNKPYGIYVDAAGNIFIADGDNHRIQKWVPGATSGITVAGGNGAGPAANQLNRPNGIYVDVVGNIFIADGSNSRIQKWSPGAQIGITVAGGNGAGSAANQLGFPIGIYVDAAGNIYIADADNQRIQKWAPGATSGITVAGGNGYGAAANQLGSPSGIYVDVAGNIFIADYTNHRIQKWVPGGTNGVTVAGGNGRGFASNQLFYPIDVYLDATGNFFIADFIQRIQKWVPGATSGFTVAGGNGFGTAANQLYEPTDVSIDASGDIFIADYRNHRIQKWLAIPTIDTTYKPTSPGSYTAVVTFPGGCTATSNAVMVTACNYWTGAVNSLWNESGNWSTGTVPDASTAVYINSGTVVVNVDAVCYSLSAAPGANITVNPGRHLTVLH